MSKLDYKNVIANEDFVAEALENRERIEKLLNQGDVISLNDLKGMSFEQVASLLSGTPAPKRAPRKVAAAPETAQEPAADQPAKRGPGRPKGSKNAVKAEPSEKKGNLWGRTGGPVNTADARKRLETATNPRQIEALNAYIAEHGRTPTPPKGGKAAPEPESESEEAAPPPEGVREYVLGRIKSPPTIEEAQAMLRAAKRNEKPRLVAALESLIQQFKDVATQENDKTDKIARKAGSAGEVVQGERSSSKRLAHG